MSDSEVVLGHEAFALGSRESAEMRREREAESSVSGRVRRDFGGSLSLYSVEPCLCDRDEIEEKGVLGLTVDLESPAIP